MSLGGCSYLTFIDDYSRRVWCFFIKTKDEVMSNFIDCKTMIEKMERGMKTLRTNNGLEFVEKEFLKFCAKEGISRHRTCVGMPLQNGVIER